MKKKVSRADVIKSRVYNSPDYKKAQSFLGRNTDSAFYYFNKVATSSKDGFQVALGYTNMGLIQSQAGDYYGAQESMLHALKFLDESNPTHYSCLASAYNELAATSSRLQNYDVAISYYDRAFKFVRQRDYQLILLNNKALAYQKKKNYREALNIYQMILREAKKGGVEYARMLSNRARTMWLWRPKYNAAPEMLSALRIRMDNHDLWGQNASYAHLADFYSNRRPDSALIYADKRYDIARRLGSPDDQIEALQKLIRLGSAQGAKLYFPIYQQLNDSLQGARNAAKNQFALIRYEAAKSKADNLKLQKENADKRYEIIRQRVLLYAVIALCAIAAIIALFWYRRRREAQERKIREAVKENQLRTSKKVHDVVANGLYRIMAEVEHRNALDKDELLDKIDVLYQQSRDISYEKPEREGHKPHEKIAMLIKSFVGEDTKVLIAGNSEALWADVQRDQIDQLEHIIQELMVNMTKHSCASMVVIRFAREDGNLTLHYSDNGVGLPADFRMGNGLSNTGSRINDLTGTISFDSSTGKGLRIRISFPIR
ncbi:tetratricopeptide repeat protein [Arcticibacter sp. MXS-1]|uniref:tetratricopeptide repeat-containing sensor histidine kinase n=1 Tax=Arcticibacter sp. MXS-1 TaxID=3341726 RepID=UPI0035A95C4B